MHNTKRTRLYECFYEEKTKLLRTVRLQALYFTQLDLFRILLNDFLRFHKFSVFFQDFVVVVGGVYFFPLSEASWMSFFVSSLNGNM